MIQGNTHPSDVREQNAKLGASKWLTERVDFVLVEFPYLDGLAYVMVSTESQFLSICLKLTLHRYLLCKLYNRWILIVIKKLGQANYNWPEGMGEGGGGD